MKPSNHQTLINCAEELFEKYTQRKGKYKMFTDGASCPLCTAYMEGGTINCSESFCPLALLKGHCDEFISFNRVVPFNPKTWEPRKEFWEAVLFYLQHDDPKKYRPSKLTKKTFQFMLNIENRIIKRYNL